MERNLRLYPVYQALRSASFYLPVFLLYFLQVVSLEEALLLEAIYYVAVVVLEVPSGFFSDRVGRRVTLLCAMACGAAAATTFALADAFLPLAVAQVLKAAGIAFNSGTDTALLFDSLRRTGREHEIAEREAHAYAWSLTSMASAAAVGGLASGFDLRAAFVLTAAAELAALLVAWRFAEPREASEGAPDEAPARIIARRLADPVLLWIFVFSVGMIVLNHVPYTFFQPYVELLFERYEWGSYEVTPAVTGMLAASMMLVGAATSRRAVLLRERIGALPALLLAMNVQLAIIGAMGAMLSTWVMALILLRTVPMAIGSPLALAEIHPRVPTSVRATYLSLQSLAGRLAFSACLALSSRAVGAREVSHEAMSGVLLAFAAGGGLLWLGLVASAHAAMRRLPAPRGGSRG